MRSGLSAIRTFRPGFRNFHIAGDSGSIRELAAMRSGKT
jgi:hypothetical protein